MLDITFRKVLSLLTLHALIFDFLFLEICWIHHLMYCLNLANLFKIHQRSYQNSFLSWELLECTTWCIAILLILLLQPTFQIQNIVSLILRSKSPCDLAQRSHFLNFEFPCLTDSKFWRSNISSRALLQLKTTSLRNFSQNMF